MEKINPTAAYYIKLGGGGDHERECIETNQTIWVGFRSVPFEKCREPFWDEVRDILLKAHDYPLNAGTSQRNQLRVFCEADENTLWVTFYQDRLWWCFAKRGINCQSDNSKTRQALGGWKYTDINGKELETSRLSGSLLSMQGFRATICRVREFDYLVRKINGEILPEEKTALQARDAYEAAILGVIQHLHWKDFELLIDLIFRQAGWQRLGRVGGSQKTIDLDLFSPITLERFIVQVKSEADQSRFQQFQDDTSDMGGAACAYFVVHKPARTLTKDLETETHKLWLTKDIAHLTVQYGLGDWVIEKAK